MNIPISTKSEDLPDYPAHGPRPRAQFAAGGDDRVRKRTRPAPKRRRAVRACRNVHRLAGRSGCKSVSLQVRWRAGPRTREWNELWQELIAGLGSRFEIQTTAGVASSPATERNGSKFEESDRHLPPFEVNRVESGDPPRVVL